LFNKVQALQEQGEGRKSKQSIITMESLPQNKVSYSKKKKKMTVSL